MARALALAARGDQPAAVEALAGALTLAWPQGYVRVFADEGAPMRALLGLLAAAYRTGQSPAAIPQDYVAALLLACGQEDPPPRRSAANRTQAVARARQMGLIP